MKKIILFCFIVTFSFSSNCSPYYNPQRFIDSPDFLIELLENQKIQDDIKRFEIIKTELYKYRDEEIAQEINEAFEYLWNDWIEDGYEMQLTPEQTLFKYKNNYLSLEVFIYGVKGDATKRTTTQVKYFFYNYTPEVKKYIKCIKIEKGKN